MFYGLRHLADAEFLNNLIKSFGKKHYQKKIYIYRRLNLLIFKLILIEFNIPIVSVFHILCDKNTKCMVKWSIKSIKFFFIFILKFTGRWRALFQTVKIQKFTENSSYTF